MNSDQENRIAEIFRAGTPILEAVRRAVQIAIWKHKQLGQPIVIWRDGKVVWIPPEEIDAVDPGQLPPLSDDV